MPDVRDGDLEEPLTHSSSELRALSGASFRQVDYWASRGYLVPEGGKNPGSGQPRRWSTHEVAVARNLVFLVHSGLTVAVAAQAARGAVLSGTNWSYAMTNALALVWRDDAIDKALEQRETE